MSTNYTYFLRHCEQGLALVKQVEGETLAHDEAFCPWASLAYSSPFDTRHPYTPLALALPPGWGCMIKQFVCRIGKRLYAACQGQGTCSFEANGWTNEAFQPPPQAWRFMPNPQIHRDFTKSADRSSEYLQMWTHVFNVGKIFDD